MGISKKELKDMNAYFRALNYISVGQLYLLDNPLLKEELKWSHVKKKIVGHWGTVPGQNFIYTHLNRIIKKNDLNMIYISGPGHGGNAVVSNVYLEGTYSNTYPEVSEDIEGLKKLFKQFSFPGGIASHAAPETPGSINEGGELGYSLSHAFGAVFDNPDLIAACVIGDGEAETGPLATSWHSNKFLNPKNDGVVLPILHRNGYKIANPTIFGRMTPMQKQMVIKALKENNTVGMIGDGVNDILALKEADCGIALGSGVSAARSVADVVLKTDDFSVLPSIVNEGRRVVNNIE